MRFIPTDEFFKQIRELRSSDELSLSDAKWLRNYYASAAKYLMISNAQMVVITEICNKFGVDILKTVKEDVVNEMV